MLGFRKNSEHTQVMQGPALDDEVPPRCVTLDDYYAHPARLTAQRVLRSSTNMGETPAFEFVHNFRLVPALAMPQVRDTVIRTVARAQASAYKEDAAGLTQVLINRVSEIQRHSGRSYELDKFYKIYLEGDSSALLKAVDVDPTFGLNRVLSYVAARIVREKSNWRDKVSTLVHQVEESADRRFPRAIDELVAELFDMPVLLRPLTGHPPESILAMDWLVQLATGTLEDRLLPRGLSMTLLRRLSGNKMPATQSVLFTKVATGLRAVSLAAAVKNRKERGALDRVVHTLARSGRFAGGAALAGAIVYRMQGLLPESAERGAADVHRRSMAAVKEILAQIPDRRAQASFLQCLSEAKSPPVDAESLRALLKSSYGDLIRSDGTGAPTRSSDSSEWSLGDISSLTYRGHTIPAHGSDDDADDLAWGADQERAFADRNGRDEENDGGYDGTMTQELTVTTDGGKVMLLSFQGRTSLVKTQGQTVLIGRDRRCDLRLDNPSVSRLHATITLDNDGFALIDQSRNGTLVKVGDADLVRVRQNRIPLDGNGFIVAGESPTHREGWDQASIKFSVMSFEPV